jgi:hypothetical protein
MKISCCANKVSPRQQLVKERVDACKSKLAVFNESHVTAFKSLAASWKQVVEKENVNRKTTLTELEKIAKEDIEYLKKQMTVQDDDKVEVAMFLRIEDL